MGYSTNRAKHTKLIKGEALRLGFLNCGISKAEFLEEEAPRLERWLNNSYHASMGWMENHFDKRLDPRLLVPGAKTVISLLLNYYPESQQVEGAPKIAKYAYGEDYHFVIKRKLKDLLSFIQDNIGEVDGRAFVDSAPVLERAWASRSGMGWIGKHSLLLSKQTGSFYFIAQLIIDLDLEPDQPVSDHCGSCTACIDACPTDAIVDPYVVDSNKCISHLTIELKEEIPNDFKGQMEGWAFGCDICQDVCPWNKFAKPHNEQAFKPNEEVLQMNKEVWYELTEEVFRKYFKKSALMRTKFKGLQRNLDFLKRD